MTLEIKIINKIWIVIVTKQNQTFTQTELRKFFHVHQLQNVFGFDFHYFWQNNNCSNIYCINFFVPVLCLKIQM